MPKKGPALPQRDPVSGRFLKPSEGNPTPPRAPSLPFAGKSGVTPGRKQVSPSVRGAPYSVGVSSPPPPVRKGLPFSRTEPPTPPVPKKKR